MLSVRYVEISCCFMFIFTVAKDYVRQYTKLKFLHAVAWPLYDELDDIPGNVTRGVADAFVDLIWELAGKE